MTAVRSVALGVTTFVAEGVLAWVLLVAFYASFRGLDTDNYEVVRGSLAVGLFVAVVLVSLVVLVTGPVRLSKRLRANPWIALAVAVVLTGLAALWLFSCVSIYGDCTVRASFPDTGEHRCSHGE